MILSFVDELMWNAPVWLKKPLYKCPVCMTPYYGSFLIAAVSTITGEWPIWYNWLLQLAVAGGINVVLSSNLEEDGSNSTGRDSE